MLIAKDGDGHSKMARLAKKDGAPYFCPVCREPVVLKKGSIYIHHFAHRPDSLCDYVGESERHLSTKLSIYDALGEEHECEIEKPLDGVRPDVLAQIGDNQVAIEVQRSNLSYTVIRQRMERYHGLGISVLWVLPSSPPSTLRPSDWQRYLHATYYGRLYYHLRDATVIPTHLSRLEKWIPASVIRGERYGGYNKLLRTCELIDAPRHTVNIAEDFRSSKRDEWVGKWRVPSCLLWIDKQRAWWR